MAWDMAGRSGLVAASSIPGPSSALSALGAALPTSWFRDALGATLVSWSVGLALTVLVAVPLGLAVGLSRLFRDATSVPFEFLKPIPPVALIPLSLLLWGPSETMKLMLIVFGAMWPLMVQVVYGVRAIDPVALDMARTYRLTRRQRILRVALPSILPLAATGLRISASVALIISVVTELVGGAPGLGNRIAFFQNAGDLPTMYGLVIVTGTLGLAVTRAFGTAERRLLRWHSSQRPQAQ
jgi:ABC-type nitrate/sulfonate/bicarbonate transport system permease component